MALGHILKEFSRDRLLGIEHISLRLRQRLQRLEKRPRTVLRQIVGSRMADRAIIELRLLLVGSIACQNKMGHGYVRFSIVRRDNILVYVVREIGRKLVRVRPYRKCENGPRPHRRHRMTSPAESTAIAVNIFCMTSE